VRRKGKDIGFNPDCSNDVHYLNCNLTTKCFGTGEPSTDQSYLAMDG
jgi:hypothetical protein